MAIARDVYNTTVDASDILLTDRVALVTGGGGGIGQGTALALAKFGADVAVLDIGPDRCAATEAAIGRLGRGAMAVQCDVMDAEALRVAIATVHERFRRIDILVNNAGGVRAGPFVTQPERSMRRVVELNLISTFVATQEVARLMIGGGRGGSIVNVPSIEAFRAAPMYATYAACKAGVVNFTRTMALELAEHGIRVNGVAADKTITPGTRGNLTGPLDPGSWSAPDSDAMRATVPLGRAGVVDECASAVVWLCSEMARYVTGTTIHVDGGTWASSGWLRTRDGGWTLGP